MKGGKNYSNPKPLQQLKLLQEHPNGHQHARNLLTLWGASPIDQQEWVLQQELEEQEKWEQQ